MNEGPIDVAQLYAALDAHRQAQGLSWRQVARELGLSNSYFSWLRRGESPGLGAYIRSCRWLGVSLDTFTTQPTETVATQPTTAKSTLDSELAALLHRHQVPGSARDLVMAALRLATGEAARQAAA